jgi:hypothetical protein
VSASGGPLLDNRTSRSPIGELVVISHKRPRAFIAFYTTAAVANRAEAQLLKTARRLGGGVERYGVITILWTSSPPPQLRTTAHACLS